jgi:hypothetical protein
LQNCLPIIPPNDETTPIDVVFVSFGAGEVHIANQDIQRKFNLQHNSFFSKTHYATPTSLHASYYNRLCPSLQSSKRGFFFWSWKPALILQAMDTTSPGSVVVYLDAGSYFKRNISTLVQRARRYGRVLFNNTHTNAPHCKGTPVARHIPTIAGQNRFWNMKQLDASLMLFVNNPLNRSFLEVWLQWCLDYELVSDSPTLDLANDPKFKEHRHDQALLTIAAFNNPTGQMIQSPLQKHYYTNHHRRRHISDPISAGFWMI